MKEIFLIQFVCVFVCDLSGFPDEARAFVQRLTGRPLRFRPLGCSLCCTWWLSLLWCLLGGCLDMLHVAVCSLAAFTTTITGAVAICIKDFIINIIDRWTR